MKFKGRGIVKWKDRTLVNFEEHKDGILDTMDERIIQRLKMIGFEEYVEPKKVVEPPEPAKEVEPKEVVVKPTPIEPAKPEPKPKAKEHPKGKKK